MVSSESIATKKSEGEPGSTGSGLEKGESRAERAPSLDIQAYFQSIYDGSLQPDRRIARWEEDEESALPNCEADAFVENLINFVTKKAGDTSPEGREALSDFQEKINEAYFSRSPSVIESCSLKDLLYLGSKANRVPEIRGWFGQSAVNDITYTLDSLTETYLTKVEAGLEGLSLPDRLDVINFLQTVAADVIANGFWASRALRHIGVLLTKMKEVSESPFLDYALDLSLERIQEEKAEPSFDSVVAFSGNGERGRLSEQLAPDLDQESDHIARSIRSSVPLEYGDRYLRISQDAIAILDRTNAPRYYGRIKESEMQVEAGIDPRVIDRLRQGAEDLRNLEKMNLSRVLEYVNTNVMANTWGIDLQDSKRLGEAWSEQVGVLTEGEWSELLLKREKVEVARFELRRFEAQQIEEAHDDNTTTSEPFIKKLYGTVANLIAEGAEPPRGWEELKRWVEANEFEIASFEAAKAVLTPYQDIEFFINGDDPSSAGQELFQLSGIYRSPELRHLVRELENLYDLHQRNLQEAQARVQERYAQAEEERVRVIIRYNELLDLLDSKAPELQSGLMRLASNLEAELTVGLPKVEFAPYDKLARDRNINPFPDSETADLPLLMQQLHRPLMRERLEDDLSVSFANFNLNSQVHLLQFLAGKNKETFGRMREILHRDLPYKKEFLTAFLSCAGDYAFGDRLADIAERFSPEAAARVFGKYAELVDASEKVRDYLRESFPEELERKAGLEEKIAQALLKKGKETLEVSSLESATEETVLARLEDVDAELQLFAAAFKTLLSEGVAADLELFPGTEIIEVRGGQIDKQIKDQMLLISDQNWRSRPHMYETIMAGFKKNLEDPNTIFYLIQNGEKVVAFFRMDDIAPKKRYFGSVNVRPEAQGFALASALLRQMFAKEADGYLVTAHCNPWDKINEQYISDAGFVATRILDYSGQPAFEIERDARPDAAKPNYLCAGLSYEDMMARVQQNPELIRLYAFSTDPGRVAGDPENERFIRDLESLVNNGQKVITAFRYGPHNANGSYPVAVAFEPKLLSGESAAQ